jgi:hypothetical protein
MIQQLINKALLKEQEDRKDRQRSGKYSPSSFGRCFRLQYWNRKNEPESNPSGISSLISMAEGTIWHRQLQSYLPKEKVEVRVETDDILGFVDWVEDDCVYDFKTTEEWKFKRYWNIPTTKIWETHTENYLQVGWYGLELKKPKCCLVGAVKGSLSEKGMVYHYQPVEALKSAILCEIEALQKFWAEQKLPPAKPRAFGGNDCTYCSWRDKCKEIENGTIRSQQ